MPISSSGRQHLSGTNKQSNNKQQSGYLKRSNPPAKTKYGAQIRHISPPSSLASTSSALRDSMANRPPSRDPSPNMKHIAGQLVLTGIEKSPDSLSSTISVSNERELYVGSPRPKMGSSFGAHFTSSTALQPQTSVSQVSLGQPNTATSSTAHLQHSNASSSLSIRRKVNLKYIKTIIIILMALDLLITIFVHQFSTQDQIAIWFTTFKMRLSLLNLLLSALWFVVVVGAILFDVYFILAISCVVNLASFVLLFGFSLIHFSRRIDYNTVNLTSLLVLLFSIIVLHVYLIVQAALTIYLMQAVRRRRKS